jgi:glutathionylspermidine amidase/synthetase
MRKGTLSSDAPFGTLLGYAPGGVAIYSSNYGSLDPRNYPEDADFAATSATNTWATSGSALSLPAVSCSSTMALCLPTSVWRGNFPLRFLRQVVNDNILPLQAFANGSKRAPRAGRC